MFLIEQRFNMLELLLLSGLTASGLPALSAPGAVISHVVGANPNCVARGKCFTTGPGTKYPEQHTLCLADAAAWHCAALAGRFGGGAHSFGPASTMDLTMMGGSPVAPGPPGSPDLNETFTVHDYSSNHTYGTCVPSGPAQWEVTRELTFLDGTAGGACRTRLIAAKGGRLLGEFEHNCTALTQIEIKADSAGAPQCVGCRCCTKCTGCACLPP